MDRVWEETNRRLAEQQPDIERDLEAAAVEQERVRGKIDRYTEAFEAGTLEAGLFGENVQALKEQLGQLESRRADLIDVKGRVVRSREVGGLGGGSHVLSLAGEVPLRAGMYWIRLTHPERTLTTKGLVVR